MQIYVGFVALIGNLVAAVVVTIVARSLRAFNGTDETAPADYLEDEGSPRLRPVAGMIR
jgi:SSS family solute:Na+ symporter